MHAELQDHGRHSTTHATYSGCQSSGPRLFDLQMGWALGCGRAQIALSSHRSHPTTHHSAFLAPVPQTRTSTTVSELQDTSPVTRRLTAAGKAMACPAWQAPCRQVQEQLVMHKCSLLPLHTCRKLSPSRVLQCLPTLYHHLPPTSSSCRVSMPGLGLSLRCASRASRSKALSSSMVMRVVVSASCSVMGGGTNPPCSCSSSSSSSSSQSSQGRGLAGKDVGKTKSKAAYCLRCCWSGRLSNLQIEQATRGSCAHLVLMVLLGGLHACMAAFEGPHSPDQLLHAHIPLRSSTWVP